MNTPAAQPGAPAADGQPPATAPVAQPQPAPAESYWAKAKEAGEEKARVEFASKLKSLFGTDDMSQLEQLAKKISGKGGDETNEATKKILDEMDKLRQERDTLVKQNESKAIRDKVFNSVMASNHRLHDVGETIEMLMMKYDFKMLNDKLVLHHKDSGNPVFLEGSNIGTVEGLIESWSKDPKQAWRFQSGSQISAPAGTMQAEGPEAGHYNYVVKPTDFSMPGFVEALQRSGQKERAYEGKPIDYERLKPFLTAGRK